MAAVDGSGPYPPGDYDVAVVGSGPAGLQTAYFLARSGLRFAVLSRDDEPGGMFQRFPVFQRLISWTKPQAPAEPGSREYEWYDHNSLLAEEPGHRALIREFMDRSFDVPAREEMETTLRAFVARADVEVRYGCRVERVRREGGEELVLETSDGEYRCRAAVFAVGVTEPWLPPIPGAELARHYVDTGRPSDYDGKRVVIIGKRNSGFEVAQGLLPWARELKLVSPRPVQTAVLALSALRVRYLQPYDEYVRGGSGTAVIDAAVERIERVGDAFRVRVHGTTRPGALDLEADEVIIATGFRTPLEPLAELDVATVADGRIPAQTPFWESVSAPGIYFAGNVTQGSPGLAKHGAAASSTAVNGFRYNARVLVRHLAEERFGMRSERPRLERDEVVPFLIRELATAPELWIQKGYLARIVSFDGGEGVRDDGILPLADFVDAAGPAAAAVAVEVNADGAIVPVLYLRRDGRVLEHLLDPHPLHDFDSAEHRSELEARLQPLLGAS